MQDSKKYGSRYPWARWFKSKQFTLLRGQDYFYQTYTMAQQVRNAAKRFNKIVEINMHEDGGGFTVTIVG